MVLSSILISLALSQAGAEPPLVPARLPLPAGAAAPLERSEAEQNAKWIEAHLVEFDEELPSSGLTVGGTHVSLVDEDFAKAFSLVPSAAELAGPVASRFRLGQTLEIVGLVPLAGGILLLEFIPILALTGPVAPLIAAVALLAGLAMIIPGFMISASATNRLFRAVNEYNRGIVRRAAEYH